MNDYILLENSSSTSLPPVSKMNAFYDLLEDSSLELSLFNKIYGGSYSIGSIVKFLLTIDLNIFISGRGSGSIITGDRALTGL